MTDDPEVPRLITPDNGDRPYTAWPVSCKMVVDYFGKVVLLKNERDEWELPGGKLEQGEAPHACAEREVREETGLQVMALRIVGSWIYKIRPDKQVLIVTYGAAYRGSEALRISSEHRELGLFSYEEVPGLNMPRDYMTDIETWRKVLASWGEEND